jgi:hypothetical protein
VDWGEGRPFPVWAATEIRSDVGRSTSPAKTLCLMRECRPSPATGEQTFFELPRDPVKSIRPYFFFWRATSTVVYYSFVCFTREDGFLLAPGGPVSAAGIFREKIGLYNFTPCFLRLRADELQRGLFRMNLEELSGKPRWI